MENESESGKGDDKDSKRNSQGETKGKGNDKENNERGNERIGKVIIDNNANAGESSVPSQNQVRNGSTILSTSSSLIPGTSSTSMTRKPLLLQSLITLVGQSGTSQSTIGRRTLSPELQSLLQRSNFLTAHEMSLLVNENPEMSNSEKETNVKETIEKDNFSGTDEDLVEEDVNEDEAYPVESDNDTGTIELDSSSNQDQSSYREDQLPSSSGHNLGDQSSSSTSNSTFNQQQTNSSSNSNSSQSSEESNDNNLPQSTLGRQRSLSVKRHRSLAKQKRKRERREKIRQRKIAEEMERIRVRDAAARARREREHEELISMNLQLDNFLKKKNTDPDEELYLNPIEKNNQDFLRNVFREYFGDNVKVTMQFDKKNQHLREDDAGDHEIEGLSSESDADDTFRPRTSKKKLKPRKKRLLYSKVGLQQKKKKRCETVTAPPQSGNDMMEEENEDEAFKEDNEDGNNEQNIIESHSREDSVQAEGEDFYVEIMQGTLSQQEAQVSSSPIGVVEALPSESLSIVSGGNLTNLKKVSISSALQLTSANDDEIIISHENNDSSELFRLIPSRDGGMVFLPLRSNASSGNQDLQPHTPDYQEPLVQPLTFITPSGEVLEIPIGSTIEKSSCGDCDKQKE